MKDKKPFPNCLITGASSGIGAALAIECARLGAKHIFITGRNEERLKDVVKTAKSLGAEVADYGVVDVADECTMRDFIARCDEIAPIELIFANAGVATRRETEENIRHTFSTNVGGVLNTALPAIEVFRGNLGAKDAKRIRKHIVITASIAGYAPLKTCPSYSASKAAVKTWGLSMRAFLKSEGIDVSVVCPGFIITPLTDKNTCPMPFLMKVDKAAKIIIRGVMRNRGLIAFPWPMRFMSWWLSTLPWRLAEFISSRLPEKSNNGDL